MPNENKHPKVETTISDFLGGLTVLIPPKEIIRIEHALQGRPTGPGKPLDSLSLTHAILS